MVVHAFNTNMKWKYEVQGVDFSPYEDRLIHEAFYYALEDAFKAGVTGLVGFDGWFICFEPNHPHSHPIALRGEFKAL